MPAVASTCMVPAMPMAPGAAESVIDLARREQWAKWVLTQLHPRPERVKQMGRSHRFTARTVTMIAAALGLGAAVVGCGGGSVETATLIATQIGASTATTATGLGWGIAAECSSEIRRVESPECQHKDNDHHDGSSAQSSVWLGSSQSSREVEPL
jgi:hypothetical protein